jgi:hypothetical protein
LISSSCTQYACTVAACWNIQPPHLDHWTFERSNVQWSRCGGYMFQHCMSTQKSAHQVPTPKKPQNLNFARSSLQPDLLLHHSASPSDLSLGTQCQSSRDGALALKHPLLPGEPSLHALYQQKQQHHGRWNRVSGNRAARALQWWGKTSVKQTGKHRSV